MNNWQSLSIQERKVILQNVSGNERLPDTAIEKDWWVTMILYALFKLKISDFLLFKGGTSLSKGWNLIERFSEDIDLSLDYHFFRDEIKNNNQLKILRKQCRKYIVEELPQLLDAELKELGLTDYDIVPVTQTNGISISTDADPTVINVEYKSVCDSYFAYIPSVVKIEISCLSMSEPFEKRQLSTIISKYEPDVDDVKNIFIPTVLPERTFLEKAFLLCEEFQKEKPRSLRMSRHLYDLHKLMDTEYAVRALNNKELYKRIVEHRREFYHVSYANYDNNYPQKINFLPSEQFSNEWMKDYEEMQKSFIYGDSPSYEDLIKRISILNDRFRKVE